jgi:hypothetical protein
MYQKEIDFKEDIEEGGVVTDWTEGLRGLCWFGDKQISLEQIQAAIENGADYNDCTHDDRRQRPVFEIAVINYDNLEAWDDDYEYDYKKCCLKIPKTVKEEIQKIRRQIIQYLANIVDQKSLLAGIKAASSDGNFELIDIIFPKILGKDNKTIGCIIDNIVNVDEDVIRRNRKKIHEFIVSKIEEYHLQWDDFESFDNTIDYLLDAGFSFTVKYLIERYLDHLGKDGLNNLYNKILTEGKKGNGVEDLKSFLVDKGALKDIDLAESVGIAEALKSFEGSLLEFVKRYDDFDVNDSDQLSALHEAYGKPWPDFASALNLDLTDRDILFTLWEAYLNDNSNDNLLKQFVADFGLNLEDNSIIEILESFYDGDVSGELGLVPEK